MQKYFQETQVLEQITEKRTEQRKLAGQLALSQAKEAKSKAYHQKKGGSCKMKKKAKAEKKEKKQGSITSFLQQTSSTSISTKVKCTNEKESELPSDLDPLIEQFHENSPSNKGPVDIEKESNDTFFYKMGQLTPLMITINTA